MFNDFVDKVVFLPREYRYSCYKNNLNKLDFTVNMTHAVCMPKDIYMRYMHYTMSEDAPGKLIEFIRDIEPKDRSPKTHFRFININYVPSPESIAFYQEHGFKLLTTIKDFIFNRYNKVVYPFVNEDQHEMFVFIDDDNKTIHLVLSFLPQLLPWHNIEMTDEKQRYLIGLRDGTYDEWVALAKAYADSHEFGIRCRLEDLDSLGLEFDANEIKRYVTDSNNGITVQHIYPRDDRFNVLVNKRLKASSTDYFEELINDETSCMYYDEDAVKFDNDFNKIRKFWNAMLIKKSINLRVSFRFRIDAYTHSVMIDIKTDGTCSPFFELEEYESKIEEIARTRQLKDIVDVCVETANKINIEDLQPMYDFTSFIFELKSDSKLFEDAKTGKMMTRDEAIEFAQTVGVITMSELKNDDNKFDGTLKSMELMRNKWSGTYYDRIDDVFHALYDVYEHRQFAEDIKKIADRYLETGSIL